MSFSLSNDINDDGVSVVLGDILWLCCATACLTVMEATAQFIIQKRHKVGKKVEAYRTWCEATFNNKQANRKKGHGETIFEEKSITNTEKKQYSTT